jgi:hypothetical protein
MSFDTTVDSLLVSDAVDQCEVSVHGETLTQPYMGMNASLFLHSNFAISPFSLNLALPVVFCSFLLLGHLIIIYTMLFSCAAAFFLMPVKR